MPYIDPIQQELKLSEEYLKGVSESQLRDRAYIPYEMEKHDRESMEEVKKALKKGRYKKKDAIQESLVFLERLANKLNIAIVNERRENKTTWELEADLSDIKKVFEQLNNLLQAIESKEVENGLKSKKKRMI
jgi:hypothetical protein